MHKRVKLRTSVSREDLESLAISVVCACLYYDLVDTLLEMTDIELTIVVSGEYCDDCH